MLDFMLFKKNVFVFFVVLFYICQNQCPANFQLPEIQTGSIILSDLSSNYTQNSNIPIIKQTYQISVQIVNSSSPIIFSILSMHTQSKQIDFFNINKQNNTQTFITVSFVYETEKWHSITYRYLLSSNPQFLIDTQTAILPFQSTSQKINLKLSNNNSSLMKTYTTQVNITQSFSVNQTQLIVMSFLKGVKYNNLNEQSHDLSLIILNQSLSVGKLILTFQHLEGINFNLSLISFSYLIFSPSHSKFSSYGGLIQKNNFLGNYTQDLTDIILPAIHEHFYGLASLSLSMANIWFDTQINSNLNFNLQGNNGSKINLIQFTYLIMGKTLKSLCKKCQILNNSTQNYYFFEGNCFDKCPQNSILISHKTEGKYCEHSAKNSTNNQTESVQPLQNINTTIIQEQSINYTDLALLSQTNNTNSKNLSSLQNQINFQQSYIPSTQNAQNQSNQKQNSYTIYLPDSTALNTSTILNNNPQVSNANYESSTNISFSNSLANPILASKYTISPQLNGSSNSELINPISSEYQSCPINAYWDGSRCLCKVGYKYINFKCILFIYSHKKNLRKQQKQKHQIPTFNQDQNQTNLPIEQQNISAKVSQQIINQIISTISVPPIKPELVQIVNFNLIQVNNQPTNNSALVQTDLDKKQNLTLSLANNQTNQTNCLSLNGSIKTNQANIYMQLKTKDQINFKTKAQMQEFLQLNSELQQNQPASTYCQQDQQNLQKFECLLIYPIGIPKTQFNLQISYSYQSTQCNLEVNVDPTLES